jgi:hypothetical protein
MEGPGQKESDEKKLAYLLQLVENNVRSCYWIPLEG